MGRLIDVGSLIRSFYTLESLNIYTTQCRYSVHSHNKWENDVKELYNDFTAKLARLLYDYTVLVVAGEMRHCTARATHMVGCDFIKPRDWSRSRESAYTDATAYSSNSILRAGGTLFDESIVQWQGGYGGDKWRIIAEAGLLYGKVSDLIFIDHCVDLTHNGSIYFDKEAGLLRLKTPIKDYLRYLDFKREATPYEVIQDFLEMDENFVYMPTKVTQLIKRGIVLGIIPDIKFYVEPTPSLEQNDVRLNWEDENGNPIFPCAVEWGTETISTVLYETDIIFDEDGNRKCVCSRC